MSFRIENYAQAFTVIRKPITEDVRKMLRRLESEGHTEKSICYSVWRECDNLHKFRNMDNYWDKFEEGVRKWSWPKGDPRWDDYEKRKQEVDKIESQLRKSSTWHTRDYKEKYPGYVYFIQGESGGPIKIGYTNDVKKRVNTLQTGHPDTLRVLVVIPGSVKTEEEYHRKHGDARLRGEWFKPTEKLLTEISVLKIANHGGIYCDRGIKSR